MPAAAVVVLGVIGAPRLWSRSHRIEGAQARGDGCSPLPGGALHPAPVATRLRECSEDTLHGVQRLCGAWAGCACERPPGARRACRSCPRRADPPRAARARCGAAPAGGQPRGPSDGARRQARQRARAEHQAPRAIGSRPGRGCARATSRSRSVAAAEGRPPTAASGASGSMPRPGRPSRSPYSRLRRRCPKRRRSRRAAVRWPRRRQPRRARRARRSPPTEVPVLIATTARGLGRRRHSGAARIRRRRRASARPAARWASER